ncbi:hypothetical protein AMJ44_09415 [candidate division WOR-1 bacterium DG_54_3]|uniref:Uncharacterized protein n=1 Tax=candidate division WOR-1 bacterium DG_54_3 TaxID=1703775 RepID=A0A0S7XTH1_UNCSA|nr:MAG: hypothetical protein AMJ44_09415 [candidate division WOR-1 bacterium DG_54_3]
MISSFVVSFGPHPGFILFAKSILYNPLPEGEGVVWLTYNLIHLIPSPFGRGRITTNLMFNQNSG